MFNHIKLNKASEFIVEQIRRAVLTGKLKTGNKLPTEKELMKSFGVSRATLREAMRSLEILGLVETRKGPSGGLFITEVDKKRVTDFFSNFLHFKNISVKELFDVRMMLETYIVENASRNIKKESLKRLAENIEENEKIIRDNNLFETMKLEGEFHRIIADVIGNPILVFLRDFVGNVLINAREILSPGEDFSFKVLRSHKVIYNALVEGNSIKARKGMEKHVNEVRKDLLKLTQKKYQSSVSHKLQDIKIIPFTFWLND
jgi:DNA-binding FadR family transcriptional regulator